MLAKILKELDEIARPIEPISVSFSRRELRNTCVLALFVRMRSCFDAARLLLRGGHCDLVHTIEREFLEAYVDLINTTVHEFYHKYLLLRYYVQHRAYQKQAVDHFVAEEVKMAGDASLRGNEAHQLVRETTARGKTNLAESDRLIDGLKKELPSLGVKENYRIRERFDMARKADMYEREYVRLSGYAHNNLHSILEQFITEESGGDVTVEATGRRIDPVFLLPLADCMAEACRILTDTFEQIDRAFVDEVNKHQEEIRRIVSRRYLEGDGGPAAASAP